MTDEKKIDLTDPNCEPTLEDFRKIARAAGDKVREESRQLAKSAPVQPPKKLEQ